MAEVNAREEATNVIASAAVVSIAIVVVSVVLLWLVTGNIYLDIYYTLENLFDAQTSAATQLAELARSYTSYKFAAVAAIVTMDTIGEAVVISLVIATVLDVVRYMNMENFINRIKSKRMKSHIIICGYNEVAENIAKEIAASGRKYVMLEPDEDVVSELNMRHMPAIIGNYTDEGELRSIAAENAATIIFLSENDFSNLVGAVTARKVNPNIRIMARATHEEVRTKMYRAGVEVCVLPEELAGIELGNRIAKVLGSG